MKRKQNVQTQSMSRGSGKMKDIVKVGKFRIWELGGGEISNNNNLKAWKTKLEGWWNSGSQRSVRLAF